MTWVGIVFLVALGVILAAQIMLGLYLIGMGFYYMVCPDTEVPKERIH